MQAQDELPARIDGAAPEVIRTEREFMEKSSGPCTAPDQAKSDFEKAGGLRPLLIWGTVLSLITWLPFAGGPVPFWAIWLGWCGPVLLFTAIAALFGQPRGSSSAELPTEYLRYEQRTTPHRPSLY
jgi:hypothetical protein